MAFINGFDAGNGSQNGAEGLSYGAVGGACCVLYTARATKPRGQYAEIYDVSCTTIASDDTQSWDLLLAKGGERKAEWCMQRRSSSDV